MERLRVLCGHCTTIQDPVEMKACRCGQNCICAKCGSAFLAVPCDCGEIPIWDALSDEALADFEGRF